MGNETVHDFSHVKTELGTIKMLRPIDSVKDRLASFYHWGDRQALEQAINICREISDIDFKELENWSIAEGHPKKFHEFKDRVVD